MSSVYYEIGVRLGWCGYRQDFRSLSNLQGQGREENTSFFMDSQKN